MLSKRRIYVYVIAGLTLVSMMLVYFCAGAWWHPVYVRLSGKKTSADVYAEIGAAMDFQLQALARVAGASYPLKKLTIIVLKHERSVQLWAPGEDGHVLLQTYAFTGFSGELGPKLRSGDRQIPEGVYKLESLNPNSRFHLSMKVNYPNAFDVEMAEYDDRDNLGGDIFIHGSTVTIGCVPIGDTHIEQLFVAVYGVGVENVTVIISPNDIRQSDFLHKDERIQWLDKKYRNISHALKEYSE